MANKKPKKDAPSKGKIVEAATDDVQANEFKYDSVPYESYVYSQTQPENLYTIAALFGLEPAKIEKARVLELGCAGGGNLIPFALAYPKSECVGVDLSGEQIAQADKQKNDLKIKNIQFQQADLTKLGKDIGKFDYIICHGVFSWVPQKVRDTIFEICRDHLSDNGLAVISYNVLPGWSAVKSLRDMMMYHTKGFKTPAEQIKESRALLTFLLANAPGNESYRQTIERELKILNTTNDSYLYHEHLELENQQFYLHEFVDMATKKDLSYVGDTALTTMYIGNFNKKVQETLSQIKDVVKQEQYIDFLVNRRFRHSILTKKQNTPKIQRNLKPDCIFDYHIQALYSAGENTIDKDGKIKFKKIGTAEEFSTHDLITSKLFLKLAEMGQQPVKLDDVIKTVLKEEKSKDEAGARAIFAKSGLMLMLQGYIALHVNPLNCVTEVSKKPATTSLVRYQASQKDCTRVTTQNRQSISIDPYTRQLLLLLDGKNDLAAMVKKLKDIVKAGDLHINKDNKPVTDEKEMNAILEQHTEATLKKLARLTLLEA